MQSLFDDLVNTFLKRCFPIGQREYKEVGKLAKAAAVPSEWSDGLDSRVQPLPTYLST